MIKLDMQETTADIVYKKLSEEVADTFCYCGDVLLQFMEGDVNSSMIVAYDQKRGYYLHFNEVILGDAKELLSLWDETKLDVVIEYDVDCLASAGLFVPIERALPEIKYFLQTGKVSNTIDWCMPDRIPQEGNF